MDSESSSKISKTYIQLADQFNLKNYSKSQKEVSVDEKRKHLFELAKEELNKNSLSHFLLERQKQRIMIPRKKSILRI